MRSLEKDVTPAVSDIRDNIYIISTKHFSSVQNQLCIEPTGLESFDGRLPEEVVIHVVLLL